MKRKKRVSGELRLPGGAGTSYVEPYARRMLYGGFGGLLLIGGIFSLPRALARGNDVPQGQFLFGILCALLILYCGAWLIATARRHQLTLTPRYLILRRVFTTKILVRKEITAFHQVSLPHGGNNWTLMLHTTSKRWASLRVPIVFEDNEAVMAWLWDTPRLRQSMINGVRSR